MTPFQKPSRPRSTPTRRATRPRDVRKALSASVEKELAARIAAGGPDAVEARDEFVELARGLVFSLVRRFEFPGVDREDLEQEAFLGLLKAIEGFDPTRGTRFSTYAVPLIHQALDRRGGALGRVVRLPSHVREEQARLKKVERALRQAGGEEPGDEAVARALGESVAHVQQLRQWEAQARSLDAPTGEDGPTIGENLVDVDGRAFEEALAQAEIRAALHEAVARLPERERFLVTRRFGLDGFEPQLLREVGERLQVTRQRVSQLEARAFALLRKDLSGRLAGAVPG